MNVKMLIALLLWSLPARAEGDSLLVLFWNLENFFDGRDEGLSAADREFSAHGERRWNGKRFRAKCHAVAKSVLWISARQGRLPDIIALAEIENRSVLQRLLSYTALQKLDYEIVHYDSPDPRGIDVALLYRRAVFRKRASRPCPVRDSAGAPLKTRDILLVQLQGERPLSVLVNHHPSKYGGAKASEQRRRLAVQCLKAIGDSLTAAGEQFLIAAGDFNDSAGNALFAELSPPFVNKALPLYRAGQGSIRFDGQWDLIDLFFVSEALASCSEMEIVRIPFLMTEDRAHAGEKPLRTYSGPKYLGGVSDHCPVLLHIGPLPE